MASVSLMFAKNLFPNPSPLLAPFTRPAMSTISIVVGSTRSGLTNSASLFNRSSGTVMVPMLGSIVQKGKFAEAAFALERQLKRVDLPTFGKPTIPHFKAIYSEFGRKSTKTYCEFHLFQKFEVNVGYLTAHLRS